MPGTVSDHLSWLRPRRSTLALFAALYLLVLGGSMQAWMFTDGFAPKPLLYDLLAPLPLWPLGVLVLAPLAVLTSPFARAGTDLLSPDSWPGMLAVGLYLYVISAALSSFAGRVTRGR